MVDAVIGRQVPAPPAIPVHVGAIVQNVGTAFAVYQAVMKNKPLFERYTTITERNFPIRKLPRPHGNTDERPHRSLWRNAGSVTTRYWQVAQ